MVCKPVKVLDPVTAMLVIAPVAPFTEETATAETAELTHNPCVLS
jgi:hypothetical protein